MNSRAFGLGVGAAMVLFGACGGVGLMSMTLLVTRGGASPNAYEDLAPMEAPTDPSAGDYGGLGLRGKGAGGGGLGYGGIGAVNGPAPVVAADGIFDAKSVAKETGQQAQGAKKRPVGAESDDEQSEAPAERTRAWFPEAFLWRPLVETDASGVAVIDAKVPDQLTTWRVLALGHSRSGQQSGSVMTFDSTMPIYVDPVIPGWLYSGDRVVLPIQVVNTTGDSVSAALSVDASGPLSGSAAGSLQVPAYASSVRNVALKADGTGSGSVEVHLVGADAAVRQIPVLPVGRPVPVVSGGVVADHRTLHLAGPIDADPKTQAATVLVFPGALAVLQSELERGGNDGRPIDGAYGFALSRRYGSLVSTVGVEGDGKAIRKLEIVSWQRISRLALAPDAATAADLLSAIDGSSQVDPANESLPRLRRAVVDGQRGDGTWSRATSTTLQAVLVETAFTARSLRGSEDPASQAAMRKAGGALERHLSDVDDAYTAAMMVDSGVLDDDSVAVLRKQIHESIATGEVASIAMPERALDVWGEPPSRSAVLAATILALDPQTDRAIRNDLVGELIGAYDAGRGFGAGGSDAMALDAVISALPTIDRPVTVKLVRGGATIASATLDPTQPKVPAILNAPGHDDLELVVDPPVPGLCFSGTLHSWVPWTSDAGVPGVDVAVELPELRVGVDSTVNLQIVAPSTAQVSIDLGLPAGAIVDEEALAGIYDQVESFDVRTDRVTLNLRRMQPGEAMTVPIVVRPAFEGTFTATPTTVRVGGATGYVEPPRWSVGG